MLHSEGCCGDDKTCGEKYFIKCRVLSSVCHGVHSTRSQCASGLRGADHRHSYPLRFHLMSTQYVDSIAVLSRNYIPSHNVTKGTPQQCMYKPRVLEAWWSSFQPPSVGWYTLKELEVRNQVLKVRRLPQHVIWLEVEGRKFCPDGIWALTEWEACGDPCFVLGIKNQPTGLLGRNEL